MNIFNKIYYRLFQKVMFIGAYFISFKEPKLIKGKGSIKEVINIAKEHGYKSIFVVSSKPLESFGLLDEIKEALVNSNLPYKIFLDVDVDPTIDLVEKGLLEYKTLDKACILAIGGGSVIDCAKVIAARSKNNKNIRKMKGLFKINHKLPLLMVAPTTAGTGSETTLAAVIVDKENHDKYAINDPHLIPKYAVLDPSFLLTLPGSVTSTTGMDALTHAVEAFIGKSNVKKTRKNALSAIKLIFENLKKSYRDPTNIEYRQNMQIASYQAGVAFTRAYVGYVHALAHSLGGKYKVPHGLANAILLPEVLKAYGTTINTKMAQIYDYVYGKNNSLTNDEKRIHLIEHIENMNKNMNIISNFTSVIKEEDLNDLVNHAYKESHPLYPVPKLLDKDELKNIYLKCMH